MGLHRFHDEPEHLQGLRRLPRGITAYGIEPGWNIPVARVVTTVIDEVWFRGFDHYVLMLHLGGARIRRLDDRRFRRAARRGTVSLQAPGSTGRFRATEPVGVDYASLYFRQSLIDECADGLGIRPAPLADFFADRPPLVEQSVRLYAARTLDDANTPTAIEMDTRGYLVALSLLRTTPAPLPPPATLGRSRLARVTELIDARMAEQLYLSDLADAAGLSPFHFARAFRAETGLPPATWLMRRRMERADELLTTTRLGIAEIAAETGFSSQSHLTRRYHAHYGLTPGARRRSA
jgi:AraC family transcriptional regulator